MNNIVLQFQNAIAATQQNLPFVLSVIGILYAIHIVNWILGYRLNVLGIYPRRVSGLVGVIVSPALHGHFNHLFFNSIPLLVLMCFVLLYGLQTFIIVTAIVVIISGLGTWLIGRKGYHVGASGVIMGYWSFLLMNAYENVNALSIALAVVCIYYFGGLLFNIFPTEAKESWEAHVFGFLSGLAAGYAINFLHIQNQLIAWGL